MWTVKSQYCKKIESLSLFTVNVFIKNHKNDGNYYQKKGCGSKRKNTASEDTKILRIQQLKGKLKLIFFMSAFWGFVQYNIKKKKKEKKKKKKKDKYHKPDSNLFQMIK